MMLLVKVTPDWSRLLYIQAVAGLGDCTVIINIILASEFRSLSGSLEQSYPSEPNAQQMSNWIRLFFTTTFLLDVLLDRVEWLFFN